MIDRAFRNPRLRGNLVDARMFETLRGEQLASGRMDRANGSAAAFEAPRIVLSAHLAATQCGIALVAFGLLWPHLTLWKGWSQPLAAVIGISFYLIWIGLSLGGLWGTGRVLPIAGAGHAAALWQERAAIVPVAIGSFGSLGAVILLLVQWRYGGPE